MRLAKSIEVALGIAAAGGAMLVLSGSAFAAGSSQDTSTQIEVQASAQSVTDGSGDTQSKPTSGTTVVSRDDSSLSSQSSESMSDTTGPHLANSQTPTVSNTTPAGGEVAASKNSALSVTDPKIGAQTSTVELNGRSSQATDDVLLAASDQSGPGAAETTERQAVTYRSIMLTIQPRIMPSRTVRAEDLASMMPSALPKANGPAKAPAPAQPSGALFSRLSAVLAGSVVPPVYLTPVLDHAALAVELTALIMVALLALRRACLTFGAWLRRGGYVHAARSDMPEGMSSLLFATPLSLSYVSAFVPLHSSFLVVSDNKTVFSMDRNAYRKEEQ